MHPVSYTGLKILHDQKIEEALEQQRLSTEQETQGKSLFQAFGSLLAHFISQPDPKEESEEECSPLCYSD
jgi:hypothetical protein